MVSSCPWSSPQSSSQPPSIAEILECIESSAVREIGVGIVEITLDWLLIAFRFSILTSIATTKMMVNKYFWREAVWTKIADIRSVGTNPHDVMLLS